jgi:hypothetical protein
MKALVSALALLSFVGATTVPSVLFAQDATSAPAPAKKTAKHSKATKTKTKAPPAEKSTDEQKAN